MIDKGNRPTAEVHDSVPWSEKGWEADLLSPGQAGQVVHCVQPGQGSSRPQHLGNLCHLLKLVQDSTVTPVKSLPPSILPSTLSFLSLSTSSSLSLDKELSIMTIVSTKPSPPTISPGQHPPPPSSHSPPPPPQSVSL